MTRDELVRLSDVIETVENQCSYGNMWGNENLTLIDAGKTIDELSDLPAVDAVEVVRCRECTKFAPNPVAWTDDRPIICSSNDPEGFCHNGTPREEDGDEA